MASLRKRRRNTATNFCRRDSLPLSIERAALVQQLHDADDHVDYRPGGGNQNHSEDRHLLCPFPRRLDQIFAAQVVTTKLPAVVVRPIAVPTAGARLKETVGAGKTLLIKLRRRFHASFCSLDRNDDGGQRAVEHTSELHSHFDLRSPPLL